MHIRAQPGVCTQIYSKYTARAIPGVGLTLSVLNSVIGKAGMVQE